MFSTSFLTVTSYILFLLVQNWGWKLYFMFLNTPLFHRQSKLICLCITKLTLWMWSTSSSGTTVVNSKACNSRYIVAAFFDVVLLFFILFIHLSWYFFRTIALAIIYVTSLRLLYASNQIYHFVGRITFTEDACTHRYRNGGKKKTGHGTINKYSAGQYVPCFNECIAIFFCFWARVIFESCPKDAIISFPA